MAAKIKILLIVLVILVVLSEAAIKNIDPHRVRKPKANQRVSIPEAEKYDHLAPAIETEQTYWHNLAAEAIQNRGPKAPLNLNKAKNIILFLGDGMSASTVTAARILQGQRQGRTGEEEVLSFEKFPHVGLSKTYCTNAQVADSACTATAYHCGVKTNIGQIGLNAKVNFNNCSAAMNPVNQVSSLAAWAQAAGKSTGIVTTTRVTHASPAGAYAHVSNRDWECDTDIRDFGENPSNCLDIAEQLITQTPGRNFNIVLGGGNGKFIPTTVADSHGNVGEREDGQNLISQWHRRHPGGLLVTNRAQLLAINASAKLPTNVMGLFQSSHLKFHIDGDPNQPTLVEMTEAALKVLRQNEKGFFVFIEGGLIDFGNHYNMPGVSLDETIELSKAVEKAVEMTDSAETLIVVTADHAHPLSISGYPGRGNNILNLNEYDRDVNGIKYATLNYAVGEKQYLDSEGNRIDLTGQFGAADFIFPSYIEAEIGVHAGDDVAVYASGPFAHMFTGVMEQNVIPIMMAYASCVGDTKNMCGTKSTP